MANRKKKKQWQIFLGSKITAVTAAMKLTKDDCSLEEKL